MDTSTRNTISRAKENGQFLNVIPSIVNGTELSALEFQDTINLRYCRIPPNLPSSCDGCGNAFTVRHAHKCKIGGRVIGRHDDLLYELKNWLAKAMKPSAVWDEPLIHTVPVPKPDLPNNNPDPVQNIPPVGSNAGDRGDILVRGLWSPGVETIIDVRFTDLDAASYANKDPQKVLKNHEQRKHDKYLAACLEQHRTFVPFVVSTDGLLGFEAKCLVKQIAKRLEKKWSQPYSVVRGFLNSRISLAIVRASHQCLRGPRNPSSKTSHRVQWLDGAGLGMYMKP